MNMRYLCRYTNRRNKLLLHLENHQDSERITDATLVMEGQPLTYKKLHRSILLHPYMTAKVYFAIYRQALALFLKRNPLYTNPTNVHQTGKRPSRGPVLK
jgi:hypothetical protein